MLKDGSISGNKHPFDGIIDAYKKDAQRILDMKWKFDLREYGYNIVAEDGTVVFTCPYVDIGHHVAELHNASLRKN